MHEELKSREDLFEAGQMGVRCPCCQKLFRTERKLLHKPPIQFECRGCGRTFGVVVPVSAFDLIATSFPIERKDHVDQTEVFNGVRASVGASQKPEEPFNGFGIQWSMILANFEEPHLKQEFLNQGRASQTLHEVVGKFARLAEVLPSESGLQTYIKMGKAHAEVPFIRLAALVPSWTMQRPLLFLLCFLVGFNFVFGLFLKEYRWLFAISFALAIVLWLSQRPIRR